MPAERTAADYVEGAIDALPMLEGEDVIVSVERTDANEVAIHGTPARLRQRNRRLSSARSSCTMRPPMSDSDMAQPWMETA